MRPFGTQQGIQTRHLDIVPLGHVVVVGKGPWSNEGHSTSLYIPLPTRLERLLLQNLDETPSQDLIPTFAPVTSISVLVPTLLRRSRLRYRLQDYDSAHISVER